MDGWMDEENKIEAKMSKRNRKASRTNDDVSILLSVLMISVVHLRTFVHFHLGTPYENGKNQLLPPVSPVCMSINHKHAINEPQRLALLAHLRTLTSAFDFSSSHFLIRKSSSWFWSRTRCLTFNWMVLFGAGRREAVGGRLPETSGMPSVHSAASTSL